MRDRSMIAVPNTMQSCRLRLEKVELICLAMSLMSACRN
jgi:hypothetical protein